MELKEAIEILGAFKLANIIEMITQEEFEGVKTAIDTVLEELNNRISKEKIRNYLDTRINIVIDDKFNSKDVIQIAVDEGIEELLKMIRQDLFKDKE